MRAPYMTANDFGMGSPVYQIESDEPQTALSEYSPRFPLDLLDHADLDSLDDARLRYARRMAADAVDHLIALMDAIDARTEDLEPQNEDGDTLDDGEADDCDKEEEPDREDGGDAEPSLGSRDRHIDQSSWAFGGTSDCEVEDEDDRTAPERHGRGFVRCGPDDHEDGHDAEDERDGGTEDGEDASHFTGRLVFRPRVRRTAEAAHA